MQVKRLAGIVCISDDNGWQAFQADGIDFTEVVKIIISKGYTLHSSTYGGGQLVFVYINLHDLNADKGE